MPQTPAPTPLSALPEVLCFIDVETTGSSPQRGRVTEVGILRVEGWASDTPVLSSWSSLVNPEEKIPVEIQALTGITNEMVGDAPLFSTLADVIEQYTQDAIFVAHQARFDYGFIRGEMERCGRSFQARTLCTVRLSQAMFPERAPHSLDAVIARHNLECTARHRALGDAEVLWHFLRVLMAQESHTELAMVMKKLMRHPSLPAHLPPDQLERIPKTPGVYKFFGLNKHPLYIGKSISLRERVSEHFCIDHRSERGMRLASEIRRIEWEQCAGDFGARLREIQLIKTEMPAHNVALRKRTQALWISIDPLTAAIRYHPCHQAIEWPEVKPEASASGSIASGTVASNVVAGGAPVSAPDDGHAAGVGSGSPDGHLPVPLFGPFVSKASVKHHLTELARAGDLCLQAMGFEKLSRRESERDPLRPCFNFQIQKCRGACCGLESRAGLALRITEALRSRQKPDWVWGRLCIEEPASGYDCLRFHHFENWQWLASTASDEVPAGPPDIADFDVNIYQLLRPILEALGPAVPCGSGQATHVLLE